MLIYLKEDCFIITGWVNRKIWLFMDSDLQIYCQLTKCDSCEWNGRSYRRTRKADQSSSLFLFSDRSRQLRVVAFLMTFPWFTCWFTYFMKYLQNVCDDTRLKFRCVSRIIRCRESLELLLHHYFQFFSWPSRITGASSNFYFRVY